ncbi:hypothetical protein FRX31_021009 [Thalictrum thalictroides]|uniref:Uncharacterized protein n=1 Tax=Thalictrum thalictroides TaxID=46969 RepID=A0A7J6VX43_THATH|nr:hypothetical protein FRX31_021009 [Thalictrum thalictroides]
MMLGCEVVVGGSGGMDCGYEHITGGCVGVDVVRKEELVGTTGPRKDDSCDNSYLDGDEMEGS